MWVSWMQTNLPHPHPPVPQCDPFGTASSLDPDDQARAQNQTVPRLRDLLDLAALHGKLVIFDLYRPPSGHPYRDSWINRTLDVLHNESSLNSSQVWQLISLLSVLEHPCNWACSLSQ